MDIHNPNDDITQSEVSAVMEGIAKIVDDAITRGLHVSCLRSSISTELSNYRSIFQEAFDSELKKLDEIRNPREEKPVGESMKYRCFNIQWDTSDDGEQVSAEDLELPTTLEISFTAEDMEDIDNVEDALSDAITEKTGFCHNGFEWEIADGCPIKEID